MAKKALIQRSVAAVALAAIVLGAAGFAGAKHAAPARHNAASGTLQYPNWDPSSVWPGTFDPANVTDSQSIMVINMIYDNLVKLDAKNRVVPDLASSWNVSDGGLVYTFHLRDSKFSDGHPVTASDVVYSIDRSLNPKVYLGKNPSPVALTYLGYIKGASTYNGKGDVSGLKAIDAHTVQITLTSPIAFFLQTLSYPTADVLEKGKSPINGLITNNPMQDEVSSGPWVITGYRYKGQLTFALNTGWYDYSKMKINKVVMPFVGDENTMYQGYESGQFAMTQVPSNDVASAKSMPDTHGTINLAIDYISFNFSKPPFNNKDLRLAASYAINRDLINKDVLHGTQVTIYSLVPKGIAGYDANGKGNVPGYNTILAKHYLALAKQQMGSKFPSSLTIDYQAGSPDAAHEYVELQSEWKAIGLNVHVQSIDFNSWLGLVTKPTASLSYKGGPSWVENLWIDDFPDAEDFTTNLLSPTTPYNIGNYDNPTFERLITAALTARGSERSQDYIKASRIALNDGAWAMIGQQYRYFRWKSNIHGMAALIGESNPYPANNDWTNVSVS